MKVINNYFNVQCGDCGTGMIGEQHWFEAPAIIVHCQNPNCIEHGNKYKLPIERIELEPYIEPPELVVLPDNFDMILTESTAKSIEPAQ